MIRKLNRPSRGMASTSRQTVAFAVVVSVMGSMVAPAVAEDTENESDGTSEFLATLIPGAATLGAMLAVFLIARPSFPNVYAPRANWLRNAFGSVALPEGMLKTGHFFYTVFVVPEDEVIEKIGCDGAIFLRVFKLGLQLFLSCSVTAVMLIAVNATAENGMEGLNGLSMANIANGSKRMWAHVVGMWLNSLIVYYTLWRNYKDIIVFTQKYKATKVERAPRGCHGRQERSRDEPRREVHSFSVGV
mmetsp:Transcript_28338/g.84835  ORF Transcript_28338/g.84835 Transcript_28338/m.84835 type:complete len:246 (-) Transcript_28338:1863-2600(-)